LSTRTHGLPVTERRRFWVGKYEIVARPIPHSAHMLRYTVFLGGTRIGALASMPSESDCLFLEKPPPVPPLKLYTSAYRPGRPKNGSRPPQPVTEKTAPAPSLDLPDGLALPQPRNSDDR
jgi:hypothetical protein